MLIIILGDIITGFKFIGPFRDTLEAEEWLTERYEVYQRPPYAITALKVPESV